MTELIRENRNRIIIINIFIIITVIVGLSLCSVTRRTNGFFHVGRNTLNVILHDSNNDEKNTRNIV